jgi:hypothetical protein
MAIQKGQRYQWSDGLGLLEALEDSPTNQGFFVVLKGWTIVSVGEKGHWSLDADYGARLRIVLLPGQQKPQE